MEKSYPPPIDKLLTLGKPPGFDTQIDYSVHGIKHDHVPDLIRMALDKELHTSPGDSTLVWAPVHAWRALAQLRATEAIMPLLELLRRIDEFEDDWIATEFPRVFGEIGPAAIDPLANYLANSSHGEWARVSAAEALGKIGRKHADARNECIGRLTNQLEQFSEQTDQINAFIVSSLVDLKAVEAAPLMEKAILAGAVDEQLRGDWEDLQIELGLKSERETPRKPNDGARFRALLDEYFATRPALEPVNPPPPRPAPIPAPLPYVAPPKVGRNDPCPCGSGKKYKKCCLK